MTDSRRLVGGSDARAPNYTLGALRGRQDVRSPASGTRRETA
jgi:hypothetical protein